MKMLMLLMTLALMFAGCTLPEKAYHYPIAQALRNSAVSVEKLDPVIQFSAQKSPARGNIRDKKVIVLARSPSGLGAMYQPGLPADVQQIIEGNLAQGLMAKGYRVASRLNDRPVTIERDYPTGQIEPSNPMFRGNLLLIVTVSDYFLKAEEYQWKGFVINETYRRPVGTRARFALTLELVDSTTSETYWSANVALNTLISGTPTTPIVLQALAQHISERIPAADPARN